ncbi:hypothetical protein ABIE41_000175 [Bosea sp. OAE506]
MAISLAIGLRGVLPKLIGDPSDLVFPGPSSSGRIPDLADIC